MYLKLMSNLYRTFFYSFLYLAQRLKLYWTKTQTKQAARSSKFFFLRPHLEILSPGVKHARCKISTRKYLYRC